MNALHVFAKRAAHYSFLLCLLSLLVAVPAAGLAAEPATPAKRSSKTVAKKEKERLARIKAMEWQKSSIPVPPVGVGAKASDDVSNTVSFDNKLKKNTAPAPKNNGTVSWNIAFGGENTAADKEHDFGHRHGDLPRNREHTPAVPLLPSKTEDSLPAQEVMFGMRVAF